MKYTETRVKINHPCPFCNLSRNHPSTKFVIWSLSKTSGIMKAESDSQGSMRSFLKDLKRILVVKEVAEGDNSATVIMTPRNSRSVKTVSQIANDHRCWTVQPESYESGWETHRIVSPNKEALRALMTDFRKRSWEVEIVMQRSKSPPSIISDLSAGVSLLEGLTRKQTALLVEAYEKGLFEIPARTTLEQLAERARLSRSTYGEHLRKAQLQIIRNSYPLLKIRSIDEIE